MKKRRFMVLLVALIVLVLLEVTVLVKCAGSRSSAKPVTTPSPTQLILTPAPTETPPPATASPVPSPTPTPPPTASPTATPEPTPTASPSPTPEPTPTPSYGTIVAQGSFSSETGTAMNMNVSWVAFDAGDGTAVVAVTGTVSSYSLQLTTIYNGAVVDFAGYSATTNTSSVMIEEDNYTVSPLFYTTVTVPLGTAGTMNITWNYGGSYGGTVLDTVTASGYVNAG